MGGACVLHYIHTAAVVMMGAEQAMVCYLCELYLTPVCSWSINDVAIEESCIVVSLTAPLAVSLLHRGSAFLPVSVMMETP